MNKTLWDKCVAFHGHSCGGLTIGYKAATYAIELLGLELDGNGCLSDDEQIVCIAENDACGIDAIQVILGCSAGKGNLLFRMRGKQAYSFYLRESGKSVRLLLRKRPLNMTREQSFEYMQKTPASELFDSMETTIPLPESARIFESFDCEQCGESTAEGWLRLQGGKKLCLDCYEPFSRFDV